MEGDNITKDIYLYIKQQMNNSSDFDVLMNIIEVGLIDSTGMLNMVMFLETKYGIEIDLEDINEDNFATVDAIAGFVKSKMLG